MRRINIIPILTEILILLAISIAGVSAQEIDVNSMDNAQLMTLLQAIMQKLEQENTPAVDTALEAELSETPVPTATLAPVIETEPETMGFSIYENKKLTVEALPAYMFIQPTRPLKSEGGQNDETTAKSPEECENHCAYDVCPWADLVCYWSCYYSCIGEPIPDWLKD